MTLRNFLPEDEVCNNEQEEGQKHQPSAAIKPLLHRQGVKYFHRGRLHDTRAALCEDHMQQFQLWMTSVLGHWPGRGRAPLYPLGPEPPPAGPGTERPAAETPSEPEGRWNPAESGSSSCSVRVGSQQWSACVNRWSGYSPKAIPNKNMTHTFLWALLLKDSRQSLWLHFNSRSMYGY